jgi:hypothetical protein
MSTQPTPRRHRPEPESHDPFEDASTRDPAARTWWERNAIAAMSTFSLAMLILVITLQVAC